MVEDTHDGALVRAQECKKRFNKKVNLRRHSMLHLRAYLRFQFREHLKIHQNAKKKLHFTLQLMIHLTVQSRGASVKKLGRNLCKCNLCKNDIY